MAVSNSWFAGESDNIYKQQKTENGEQRSKLFAPPHPIVVDKVTFLLLK